MGRSNRAGAGKLSFRRLFLVAPSRLFARSGLFENSFAGDVALRPFTRCCDRMVAGAGEKPADTEQQSDGKD